MQRRQLVVTFLVALAVIFAGCGELFRSETARTSIENNHNSEVSVTIQIESGDLGVRNRTDTYAPGESKTIEDFPPLGDWNYPFVLRVYIDGVSQYERKHEFSTDRRYTIEILNRTTINVDPSGEPVGDFTPS